MRQKLLIVFSEDDEIVPNHDSKRFYFELKHRYPLSVYFLELKGKHNGSLLFQENQSRLETFVHNHCTA